MRPRSTKLIASLPKAERLRALAEGLQMTAEHALAMESAAAEQTGPSAQRVAAAVRAISDEEAGKYLILLDAVRSTMNDQAALSRQLARCGDHLAKGIYQRVAMIRPATFGELLRYIHSLRVSHYLDGPNDVDWIFGNVVESEREERLYVDFVRTDDGATMWLSPARYDVLNVGSQSSAVRLVQALHRVGADTIDALTEIVQIWDGFTPTEETHWQEVHRRNETTLDQLAAIGCGEASVDDWRVIVESWGFPLAHADLNKITVDLDDLREERRKVLARLNAEMYAEMYADEASAEYAAYEAEMRAEYESDYSDYDQDY